MDVFLKDFFPQVYHKMKEESAENMYCKFDSQVLTAFTSSLYLAGLIASFLASATTRVFGRKVSMLFGGATFLVGSAINGAALNVAMLIIGRIFLGVGVGFANQVTIPLSNCHRKRRLGNESNRHLFYRFNMSNHCLKCWDTLLAVFEDRKFSSPPV